MKMYKAISGNCNTHNIFKFLWNTACRLRHKIFFWLLLHDRLSTRNLLHRRSMYLEDYNCALRTDSTEETLSHLFWNCPFSLACWFSILPTKQRGISTYDEILLTRYLLPKDIAMEIIIMGCWSTWMVRNDKKNSLVSHSPERLEALPKRRSSDYRTPSKASQGRPD